MYGSGTSKATYDGFFELVSSMSIRNETFIESTILRAVDGKRHHVDALAIVDRVEFDISTFEN